MKEVMATAMNVFLSVVEGKLCPIVEAVITVSEPHYRIDSGGELEQYRIPDTFRFCASPKTLRSLAEKFKEWADEAEAAGKATADREIPDA